MPDIQTDHRDWYERIRADATFQPRLISGSPKDRLAGLDPLLDRAKGTRILDIGCHKGLVAHAFSSAGAALIHGIDHSPSSICTAKALHAECEQPHLFAVFDLREGGAALDRWIENAGGEAYDIVLYLGVHHHLERQMERGELDALVLTLAAKARSYLAVRTPAASISRLDGILRRAGFACKHASDMAANVSPLRIYARSSEQDALAGLFGGLENPPPQPDVAKIGLPDTAAEKLYSDMHRWIGMSDVCFLSISKSGRTWVRYFLHKYFGLISGHDFDMRPRTMPRTPSTPSICFSADYLDYYEFKPGVPRIVLEPEMSSRALVLMLRDPRDVVISYYHYIKAFSPAAFSRLVPSGNLQDFIDSPIVGLELISRFHNLEIEYFQRHPGPKHLLTYEALWSEPAQQFAELLRFLCCNPELPHFAKALDAARFESMQAFEIGINRSGRAREFLRLGNPDWDGDTNGLKVRRGGVGGFKVPCPGLADANVLAERYPATLAVLHRAVAFAGSGDVPII